MGGVNNPATVEGTSATLVIKAADQSVINSVVLINDLHLALPVNANDVYEFLMRLDVTVPASSGIRFKFVLPAAAVCTGTRDRLFQSADISTRLDLTAQVQCTGGGITGIILVWGLYVGGANAGTMQLQWAQTIDTGANTTLLQNSYIKAHKLN